MIYHLSLQTAGLIAGLFLLLVERARFDHAGVGPQVASQHCPVHAAGIRSPDASRSSGASGCWPRWKWASSPAFRKPLLIGLPIGFFLVLRFVEEFLAVRALGILFLLAAEPLLEAAFLRYETSRLLVTVFAYLLIVAGLVLGDDALSAARSDRLERAQPWPLASR